MNKRKGVSAMVPQNDPIIRLCLCLLPLFLMNCGEGPMQHPSRVADTIAHFEGDIQAPDGSIWLEGFHGEPVITADGPGNFLVETRQDHLLHFPCSQCHTEEFQTPPGQSAHWDLLLKHGSDQVMDCNTCHDKATQMESLKSLTGATIPFNQTYDLCGQCHFEQKKDWMGGAHGKRIKSWSGPRMVRSCTGCHNPHDPSFEKRWPAMAPGPVNTQPSTH